MDNVALRNHKVSFNIILGIPMLSPHLTALLKKSHPNWYPDAIKSSIMTNANVLNLASVPIVEKGLKPLTSLQLVKASQPCKDK